MKQFLVIAAFSVLALLIGIGVITSSAPVKPLNGVQAAPKVDRSSVGRKTTQLALPADLPRKVLLPVGNLTAASGSSPHWSLAFVTDGNYPNVMQAIRELYTSSGYIEPSPSGQPYFFNNDAYKVSIVGESRDHSASITNITAIVDIK